MPDDCDSLWYVSYGSNLYADRLGYYLTGGCPPHSTRTYPGARSPRPPRQIRGVWLPGHAYFALESAVWTGGMAFYDPRLPGRAAARAYLIGRDQFADIVTQEMHRDPWSTEGAAFAADVEQRVSQLATSPDAGAVRLGPGRYETLLPLGAFEGAPLLTFTAPWASDTVPPTAPSAAYLRMLAAGLVEAHGWTDTEARTYLAALPGARGTWTAAQVTALLAPRSTVPSPAAG